jgi:hypothetical protein
MAMPSKNFFTADELNRSGKIPSLNFAPWRLNSPRLNYELQNFKSRRVAVAIAHPGH